MTTIRLDFPAGRYHATPHGRHVNEGVPEWPPSPYRLIRALFDIWQRKCPQLSEKDVESVLAALSESEPEFHLPSATATHTRSYLSANATDSSDKNLVFDSFLAFDRFAACYVSWRNVALSDAQQETLDTLLRNLNYLGRSESWVRAEINDGNVSGYPCAPLETANDYDGEPVSVACVLAPREYAGKQPWLSALTASTGEVMKQRASGPPLLRSVQYLRPDRCIETDPMTRTERKKLSVQAVLLTLDSTVLPLVTSTLEVAEQIRICLMGSHKRMVGGEAKVSPLFSGKAPDGGKRLDHGHLYVLPMSTDGHRIDRVLLISKLRAWDREELDAVQGVRKLWQRDNRPDVRCVMSWYGPLRDQAGIWTKSQSVESSTPFVSPRHWRKGRDFDQFLADEVVRECSNHGLPAPLSVRAERRIRDGLFECVEYRRNRKNEPVRPGYAIAIEFSEPVLSPFAIGYGAHFGLGQFRGTAK